jgi:hypothetical protein
MPNGGLDNCGTCWFNAKNKGEVGHQHARDPEPPFCAIRGLPIADPFYTYCENHAYRRPERDPIPIGPVLTGDSLGRREVWMPSPDTEEIRLHLVALLDDIGKGLRFEQSGGASSDEVVVRQLGEFKETRAIAGLERVAGEPRTAFGLARAALQALKAIRGELP